MTTTPVRAKDIVIHTNTASLPPGAPLPFGEIISARFDGANQIVASVVMFDGQRADMRLKRWEFGWSRGWDAMPGGDISLENGAWQRVFRDDLFEGFAA